MNIKHVWIVVFCLLALSWSIMAAETTIRPSNDSEFAVGSQVTVQVTSTRPVQRIVVRDPYGYSETHRSTFVLNLSRLGDYNISVYTNEYCVECSDDYVYHAVNVKEPEVVCKDYFVNPGLTLTGVFGEEHSFTRLDFRGDFQFEGFEFGIWGILVNNDLGAVEGASFSTEIHEGWFIRPSFYGTFLGTEINHWDLRFATGKLPSGKSLRMGAYAEVGYIVHGSENVGLWKIWFGGAVLCFERCFFGVTLGTEIGLTANWIPRHAFDLECYDFFALGVMLRIYAEFVEF